MKIHVLFFKLSLIFLFISTKLITLSGQHYECSGPVGPPWEWILISGPQTEICAPTGWVRYDIPQVNGHGCTPTLNIAVQGGSSRDNTVSMNSDGTGFFEIDWDNLNQCNSLTNAPQGKVFISGTCTVAEGQPTQKTYFFEGCINASQYSLSAPTAISGPTSIDCGTEEISVSIGAPFNSHIEWTLPSGWIITQANSGSSQIKIRIPKKDCTDPAFIYAKARHNDCNSLVCDAPSPLKITKKTSPNPVIGSLLGGRICNLQEEEVLVITNGTDPSFSSFKWSVSGQIIANSPDNEISFKVKATSLAGTGVVTCIVTDNCCKTKTVTFPISIGKPILTYLDFSPDYDCPEYRVETDLVPADKYHWQWYKEPLSSLNQKTTTANSTKLTLYDGPAYYRIAVKAENRCGFSNEIWDRIFVPCGGNDGGGHLIVDGGEISLFPNPNNGEFEVKIDATIPQEGFSIFIFDAQGKAVFSKDKHMENTLSIPTITIPGVYMVQVKTSNAQSLNSKIIIR